MLNIKYCRNLLLAFVLLYSGISHSSLIYQINIDSNINPLFAQNILMQLDEAKANRAELIIMHLDTKGGMPTAVESLVTAITNSSIPVVSYIDSLVANEAISLIDASHVVAMSSNAKIFLQATASNSSSRFIRKYHKLHASKSVVSKQAIELAVKDAIKIGFGSIIADNLDNLLQQINGKTIKIGGKETSISTKQAKLQQAETSLQDKILIYTVDATVAYALLLLAIYGILLEITAPGTILPALIASFSLLLALHALYYLPVNYIGVVILLFAVVSIFAELFIASFGLLAMIGISCLFLGAKYLFLGAPQVYQISSSALWLIAFANVLLIGSIVYLVYKSHKARAITGIDAMIGKRVESLDSFSKKGTIVIDGVKWQAKADTPIKKHDIVEILSLDGLKIKVSPVVDKQGE